jgi:hypothetical protein
MDDSDPEQHRFVDRQFAADLPESRRGGGAPPEPTAPARTYQVPHRFGIGSVLVVTAFFCLLLGAMRYWVPPLAIAYIGLQILAAAVMQVVMRSQPRGGSALAGAVLLPAFLIGVAIYQGDAYIPPSEEFVRSLFCSVIGGGLVGYSAGVLIAAVFMFMHMAGEIVARKKADHRQTGSLSDTDAPP